GVCVVVVISLTLATRDGAGVSSVLTVMTLGMFYSAVAKTAFKDESQHSLHHF
ncbi:hypothetical protein MKX01_008686, partial [Papaver californicum]